MRVVVDAVVNDPLSPGQYVRVFGFEVEKAIYRTLIQSLATSPDPSVLLSLYQDVGHIFSKPNFISLLRHCLDPDPLPDPRAAEELITGSAAAAASPAAPPDHRHQDLVQRIDELVRLLSLTQTEKLACFLSLGLDPEPLINCGDIEVGKCDSSHPEVNHFLLTSLSLNPNHSSIRSQLQEAIGGE